MKRIKGLICLLMGHSIDWDEYDLRIEKEQHYAAMRTLYCKRCQQYKKYL